MTTWDIWTERGTSAYSGKGPAKARGYEHHVVSFGRKPRVTAEVAFENYGWTCYDIEASGGAKPASLFRYGDGVVIDARLRGMAWSGTGTDGDVVAKFALDLDVPKGVLVMPSFLARWVGLGSSETKGTIGRYVPVPEDGFGVWRPPCKQWFPVMNAWRAVACDVVARQVEEIKVGRAEVKVRPLAHVDPAGDVVATLYLDPDDGGPVRYETLGCVLTVVDEATARARGPKS